MASLQDARRRLPIAAALVLVGSLLTVLWPAADANAAGFRPPNGKVFHGVSSTGDVADFQAFRRQVNHHSAVTQDFYHWGVPLGTGALQRWRKSRSRGVLSLSTAPGGRAEVISPRAIAQGRGDDYILSLNDSISDSKQVVYIRLMAEMNGHWNPYSAFNADGTSRGRSHSTRSFKEAWRRFAIIVRGGARKSINRRLRKLKMPRLLRARSERDSVYARNSVGKRLRKPKVSLMWVPQTAGSPDLRANRPKAYWPGAKYVDWVGADAYAKFDNATLWRNLNRFYRDYRKFPFVIGEYAPWDNDQDGSFVRRLWRWADKHGRTRMLIYYRSVNTTNIFNIDFWPAAQNVLQARLDRGRVASHAPEYQPR